MTVRCDFCGRPDVRWSFPCRNHDRPPVHVEALIQRDDSSLYTRAMDISGHQYGPWAACSGCKALIMRGERVRLARRSAKRALAISPLPIDVESYTEYVRQVQDAFWANREGPPIPVTKDWRPE